MRFVSIFVIFCTLCNSAFGSCDWTKIKKNPDNTYTYSEALHRCVGNLVQDNQVKAQQIADLNKALTMKDLALQEADKRATLWSNTSENLEGRLQKVDSLEKNNQWLFFGIGVLATVAAAYTANKVR